MFHGLGWSWFGVLWYYIEGSRLCPNVYAVCCSSKGCHLSVSLKKSPERGRSSVEQLSPTVKLVPPFRVLGQLLLEQTGIGQLFMQTTQARATTQPR
ncbi:uncharacterized protein B0T15DRAFT_519527 [Chaetomium strumarium]|uniref:Secreted protein n=1 Tax=Chaetomium strumarium TaxID=1170767 RepID=A0AAJ0M6M2_9PEZI|nr:hypothetical protein B0T15DRAFT_519527 [Chaetomium strumarium]